MSHTEAGLDVLHRVLLALLVCLALLLLVGCSGDPECFAAPFLPQCFDDDDDEEKKPDNTAPQATSALVERFVNSYEVISSSDSGERVVIARTPHYGTGQSTYKGLTKRSTRSNINLCLISHRNT